MMTPTLRKVVDALQSGRFHQIYNQYDDCKGGYCGMGVAMMAATGRTPHDLVTDNSGPSLTVIVDKMMKDCGLKLNDQDTIFQMNDVNHRTLPEIGTWMKNRAAEIEREW